MTTTTDQLLRRVDGLIKVGEAVLRTEVQIDYSPYVDGETFFGFRSAALSFVERVYGSQHPHYAELARFDERKLDSVRESVIDVPDVFPVAVRS